MRFLIARDALSCVGTTKARLPKTTEGALVIEQNDF